MKLKQRIAAAFFILLLVAGAPAAATLKSDITLAADPSPITIQVEVGFDGHTRAGFWVPVTVDLENQGPDFDGEVRVSAPSGGTQPGPLYQSGYSAPVVLPRGGHKRVTVYIPYSLGAPRIEVDLVSGGKMVESIEPTINIVGDQNLFIGVVGERASAWNLLTTLELPIRRSEVEVVTLTATSFPEHPEVLGAFDVIALGDIRAENLSPGSLDALEAWVAGGGTLVLTGGAEGKTRLKGLPGTLLPVDPGDAVQLTNVSILEQMGAEPLSAGLLPTVTESRVVSGSALAWEGHTPLAVLGSYGNGRVLYLAFDPAAQPLAGWGGMPQVWKELLFQALPPSVLSGSQYTMGSPSDLATRWLYSLSNAVSNLPALELPSINLLAGLIVGYILLVGPLSYLILRRLRRPGLAWATIPVLVLLFSGGAYFIAYQAKGHDVQVSAATIVERTSGSEWARVRQLVGVLAPSEGDYYAKLPGQALVGSWSTGSVSGTGDEPGTTLRYREDGSEAEFQNMGMWTMRSLWSDSFQRVDDGLSPDLYLEGDHLKGTVRNTGTTHLKETWIFAGSVAQGLGALGPGDSASVDIQLVDAAAGSFFDSQIFYGLSQPSGNQDEQRRWQQRLQVLSAAMDGRYLDPPPGAFATLVSWTDEIMPDVLVNGTSPAESSLTVFVDPVTPSLPGAFSLPGGLLTGRIVDINTQMKESTPWLSILDGGDITYEFDLPACVAEPDRVAVQIPLPTGSANTRGVQALAYNWSDDTWEPLDLKAVNLQQPTITSPSVTITVPPGVPTPVGPGLVTSSGGVTAFRVSPYGQNFSVMLEGEISGQEFISDSGAVRVKLAPEDGVTFQMGTPSLAVRGVAVE